MISKNLHILLDITKMSKSKFWLVVIGILFLNLLILFWREGIFYNTPKLSYGKTIQKISFVDINGNKVNISNNKCKIVYFASLTQNEEMRIAHFLEMLYQKYINHGLQIIAIFKGRRNDILELKHNAYISYPIVNYEENSIVKRIFSFPGQSKGLIILDQSNVIRFMSSFFKENDIRQLIEKFILGKISYPPLNLTNSLKEGKKY